MNNELIELLVGQLWQVTILAVVVGWLTRTVLRNHPEWSYQLWLVVMVKCVTPPIWSSHCGVFSWLFQRLSAVTSSSLQAVFGNMIDTTHLATALIAIWFGGVVVSLLASVRKWQLIQGRITKHEVTAPLALQQLTKRLASELGIRRKVQLVVSSEPIGPAVIGVWKPMLILPEALLRERSEESIEPILAHELLHVQRGDTWVAILETVVRSVWWFHPQIQRAADAMSQAGELCCDQDVLSSLSFSPRRYADSLLQVLEVRCRLQPLISQPGVRQEQVTRSRLKRIMTWDQKRSPLLLRVLSLLLILLLILPGRSI